MAIEFELQTSSRWELRVAELFKDGMPGHRSERKATEDDLRAAGYVREGDVAQLRFELNVWQKTNERVAQERDGLMEQLRLKTEECEQWKRMCLAGCSRHAYPHERK